jgi:hypothetical protein
VPEGSSDAGIGSGASASPLTPMPVEFVTLRGRTITTRVPAGTGSEVEPGLDAGLLSAATRALRVRRRADRRPVGRRAAGEGRTGVPSRRRSGPK